LIRFGNLNDELRPKYWGKVVNFTEYSNKLNIEILEGALPESDSIY
jgi:hypothetical protein